MDESEVGGRATQTPRVLWIELTSKCPFDCVFCSRKFRRGSGQHLSYELYRQLLHSLVDPRRLLLNYSGESIYYPELIPAIELARSRGAFVELVSAFASIPPALLRPLASSGLGRLTISVHATDPAKFAEIYRYSSFENLAARLEEFLIICRELPSAPTVDFAFVAMRQNLDQLAPVAKLARDLGVRDITIFPVMRRDEIPVHFPEELASNGTYTADFSTRLRDAMVEAATEGVRFSVGSRAADGSSTCLGEVPVPFAGPLPAGARIHTCEQNPWETAHVLSNGDVVVCEVLDKIALGNLAEQSIEEIWQGEKYRTFRQRYSRGEVDECRGCAWKSAYLPAPLQSEILARNGGSAQLLHGWHPPVDEGLIWGTQQAAAVLKPRPGSRSLHVSALLPPGPGDEGNELAIWCNGREVGRVANESGENLSFGLDFDVPAANGTAWKLDFRARHVLRPRERGLNSDTRDLGFGLVLLKSNRAANGTGHAVELARLRRWVDRVDRAGRLLRRRQTARFGMLAPPGEQPGISVVIPERDNAGDFSNCLESVEKAAARFAEPVQVIAVVNGSDPGGYQALRRRHSSCDWQFAAEPLGFPEAIRRGLTVAHHEWVYLLNSDMELDERAFQLLAALRSPETFAIGSQIFLKDSTRYREETNWTAFLLEDGLATVHDRIPQREQTSECFYVGGGASLFQRRVLLPLVEAAQAFAPFYWEDVEWGWRARKRGYRVMFSPQSIAHHRQRATIARHYDADAIETITERNRLLFQFRNLTECGSLERLFEELGRSPGEVVKHFLDPRVVRASLRVRLWNHLAARDDARILEDASAMKP